MQNGLPVRLALLILIASSVHSADNKKDKKNNPMITNNPSNSGNNVDRSMKIKPISLAEIRSHQSDELRKRCSLKVLEAYSLKADAPTLDYKNKLCPNLKQNCCGPYDIENIPGLWEADQKRMQAYNVSTLRGLRYMLGYSKEYVRIASQMIEAYDAKHDKKSKIKIVTHATSSDPNYFGNITDDCAHAAREMVTKQNYDNRKKTEIFYRDLSRRARFFQTVRHKFYCTLCSPKPKGKFLFIGYSHYISKKYKRVRTPKKMCLDMANNTVITSYSFYHNYGPFVSNLLKITKCLNIYQSGNTSKAHLDTLIADPFNTKTGWLKNYDVRHCNEAVTHKKADIDSCYGYCKMFNMAAPTPHIDGDVTRVIRLVQYLEPMENIMKHKNFNLFNDDMQKLKPGITDMLSKMKPGVTGHASRSSTFFVPIDQSINIASFDHMVSTQNASDGSLGNPMELGEKTKLYFEYKSAPVCAVLAIFAVLVRMF